MQKRIERRKQSDYEATPLIQVWDGGTLPRVLQGRHHNRVYSEGTDDSERC